MSEISTVVKAAANILASPAELTKLSVQELVATGRRAIELAGSFEEIKLISAQADALRAFQRSIGASVDAQNAAAEIRIRAEIRLGEELSKIEKNKGTAGPGRGNIGIKAPKATLGAFTGKQGTAPTLADEAQIIRVALTALNVVAARPRVVIAVDSRLPVLGTTGRWSSVSLGTARYDWASDAVTYETAP